MVNHQSDLPESSFTLAESKNIFVDGLDMTQAELCQASIIPP
jgi:hypothetical protein